MSAPRRTRRETPASSAARNVRPFGRPPEGVRVRAVRNPATRWSLCGMPTAFSVTGRERFEPLLVHQAVELSDLAGVRPDTVRVFRFDSGENSFELIVRSGLDLAGMRVWSQVTRPGTYVTVGAPRDRLLHESVKALGRGRAEVDAAEQEEHDRLTTEALLPFINADPDELHAARQALTVVELQTSIERFLGHDFRHNSERQPEAFLLPGGATPEAFRRQLTRLQTPLNGLPEETLSAMGATSPHGPPWPADPATLHEWPKLRDSLRDRLLLFSWFPWPPFCWLWSEDWWMYHANAEHTGHASGCSGISSSMISQLHLHKSVGVSGAIITTPTIVGGKAYVGTMTGAAGGNLYRIDLASGAIENTFSVPSNGGGVWSSGVCSSPAVVDGRVYFSSVDGLAYCIDAHSFAKVWSTDLRHPDPGQDQYVDNSKPAVGSWPSPLVVNDKVYVGVGLGEDAPGPGPAASFGFVYCLSAHDGKVKWLFCTNQFETGVDNSPNVIPPSLVSGPLPAPFTAAAADPPVRGASVWSSCAYERHRNRIFVGTGNPNPDHALPNELYSSGVLSLEADTGHLHGFYQPAPADSYRPSDDDVDVPCPPTVYTRHHRHIVGCGSKNGSYFLLDAATMTPIAKRQLLPYKNDNPSQPLPNVDTGGGENHSGVYGSAAIDYATGNLFVGLGGWGASIDTPNTPFVRAIDWHNLDDKWPTAVGVDGVRRYTTGDPPLYTNDGECGLGSPAIVHDLVFVPTNLPALYAFDTATGAKLWTAPGLPGGGPGDSTVVIGPAIADDYVVIGCQSTLYIYSLRLPIWIPWWLPEVGPAIQWPPPPWPPPPNGYQPENGELAE
jgi:outer membrane protein assembly factor BamB